MTLQSTKDIKESKQIIHDIKVNMYSKIADMQAIKTSAVKQELIDLLFSIHSILDIYEAKL